MCAILGVSEGTGVYGQHPWLSVLICGRYWRDGHGTYGHDALVEVAGIIVEVSFCNDLFHHTLGILAGGYGGEVTVALCAGVGGIDHF